MVSLFVGLVDDDELDEEESLELELLELELDELDPLLLLFEELLPYPSEYQPPPFKMKLPLVICRRA